MQSPNGLVVAAGIVIVSSTQVLVSAQDAHVPADNGGGRTACSCGSRGSGSGALDSWRQSKRHHQETWWGYPEEFCERPLGASLHEHAGLMISKGDEARMVLYDYDFENGSAKLTCRGTEQIKKIARMVPENFYSVRVAPARNCNEDLDVKRRDAVWKELSRLVAIPAERVITDRAPSRGLAGREAIKVEANLLRATEAKGNIVGAGGSLTGLGSASSAR